MKEIPEHVLRNSKTASGREWKSKKRKEIRAAIRALEELRFGCAFMPNGGDDVMAAADALERVKQECSVKDWGR